MTTLDPTTRHDGGGPQPSIATARAAAGEMSTIDLPALEGMALMNRVDTKYIFDVRWLASLLDRLGSEYRVMDIDGTVLHRYENQYFDTVDFRCYREHHNEDLPRFKFRHRTYADLGRTFFEVKTKTNQGRTVKERIAVESPADSLGADAVDLIGRVTAGRPWRAADLVPSVVASFERIAIARPGSGERATIDVGLRVGLGDAMTDFDAIAICELKQSAFARSSPLADALKERGVRPHRMTKYCLGVLSARPDVKANDFKPMVREIVQASGS